MYVMSNIIILSYVSDKFIYMDDCSICPPPVLLYLGPPPKFFDLELGFESRGWHFCAKLPEYFPLMWGGMGVLGVRVFTLKPLSRRGNSHFTEFWLGVPP